MRLLLIVFILSVNFLYSQIIWNGIYSFEVKKGGENSSEETNGLRNDNFTIFPGKIQLFIDAEIEDGNIYFNSKVEASTFKTLKISPLNVYQLSVSFINLFNTDFNIEAGRILSPFGIFAKDQHSPDNPFLTFPLYYTYGLNLNRITGYSRTFPINLKSSTGESDLTIAYIGTYHSGVKLFGSFSDGLLLYDLAITNAPLNNCWSDLELNKQPAFIGRVGISPHQAVAFGVSFADGAYLDKNPVNNNLNLNEYRQTTFGADFRLNYAYYDFKFEYINNNFNSPYLQPGSGSSYTNLAANKLDLKTNSFFTSLKVDFPFLPGSYAALKYEILKFNEIQEPILNKSVKWDDDISSMEFVLGYKLSPRTLMKVSFQKNTTDVSPEPDDDIFGLQISVKF